MYFFTKAKKYFEKRYFVCDFTKSIKKWAEWFDSNNSRCVVGQVQHLLFDTFIFKLLQCGYSLSESDSINGREIKKQNQMLHWFIDRNFVISAYMAIRRLLDQRDDVISLQRLVDVMDKNRYMLTRQNYAKKFDYYSNLSKYKNLYLKKISENASCYKQSDEIELSEEADTFVLKYEKSEKFHDRFDKLCNKEASNRDALDEISGDVFDEIRKKLETCKNLIKVPANKVFAHTDKKKFSEDIVIEYEDIYNANKILAYVVNYIALNLLGDYSISMLPRPPKDWLKYMNQPLIQEQHYNDIHNLWNEYSKELNS